MNYELNRIHRQKSREYTKRGKSEKYKKLSQEFESKYNLEAQKYMQKNINELKETNPGRAYKVLKRMGAQPGDFSENDTFILPNQEIE